MINNQKKTLFLVILFLGTIVHVESEPLACGACLTAVGAVIGGTGTSAGGCFVLGFPPAVCSRELEFQ